ncbi:hypothetical protein [Mycolicibacterium brumae]|uniref:Uncharacterized protein n=1 Tax=Mycolicibacterium brumae TaxID=85968 RepID=A0A2G5P7S1_9MYCO|nr:hypothetical protein [Mycolicibacterium brumae]MCV7194105.1 hypothetical protein [Mycolicibacterium brumae]PIB74419.1 hypothetical protein CQY22_013200 [Mycolicibacterium brumae]RWA22722.1 hypothetical protein MBRU_12290 [Mycolicibacterium brumae DSM 44177]UWW07472.1 hypothetical protein L2Z93_000487 [Mycolicibacterium brumae]
MTVVPYATQAQGWGTFADELLTLATDIDPGVLLVGQSGGKISEAIDDLYTLRCSVESLADSASEMSAVCAKQDGYDVDLANCPATRERVEAAARFAKDMRVMLRRGQVEPEQVVKADEVADELAQQRKAAVEKHAGETAGTKFPEVPTCEMPDAHYPGGDPGKKDGDPGTKGGDDEFGDWGTPGGKDGEKKPEGNPEPGDDVTPLPEIVSPEPSGPSQTPAPRVFSPDGSVELRPERVPPETTLSRGDSTLVAPSSSMLGQQAPTVPSTAPWQPPQYTGINPIQNRMLGNVNPSASPQRKDRQQPDYRPVPIEVLAAVPVAHHVASPTPSAPTPNTTTPSLGTPGTHTSAASTPASTTPGGQTPSGVGPTVSGAPTIGPGARTSLQGGGMREKPSIPENLKAVLDADVVRDLEASFDALFPEPDKPDAPSGTPPLEPARSA